MMDRCIEPYAKENNLLQLSLFYFDKTRPVPTRTLCEWSDKEGTYRLECICKEGVPGSFEQDVYTACMRIWVKQGMQVDKICLNYSDIARELGLNPQSWGAKIKRSLIKLALARYEFTKCFVQADEDGNIRIDTYFSLFDSASLFRPQKGESKRKSQSELIFPDIIKHNLQAKYYQFLDMVWYRALPDGLPRRMYEYLAKRRYHSSENTFIIAEELVCRWLGIKDKNVTHRRRCLKNTAEKLIEAGFLSEYLFDKQKYQCHFRYGKRAMPAPEDLLIVPNEQANVLSTPKLQPTPESQESPKPFTVFEGEVEVAGFPMESEAQESALPSSEVERPVLTPEVQRIFIEALGWLDSIPYFHRERKKEIAVLPLLEVVELFPAIKAQYERMKEQGKAPSVGWVYKAFVQKWRFSSSANGRESESGEIPPQELRLPEPRQEAVDPWQEEPPVPLPLEDEGFRALLSLVKPKHIGEPLKQTIADYYRNRGSEYVKVNILYANALSKKNYPRFLQEALQKNWGANWMAERQNKQEAEAKARQVSQNNAEELQRKKERIAKAKEQRERFLGALRELSPETKKAIWEQADSEVPKISLTGEEIEFQFRRLGLKVFCEKFVVDYLNQSGGEFLEEVSGICREEIWNEIYSRQFIKSGQDPIQTIERTDRETVETKTHVGGREAEEDGRIGVVMKNIIKGLRIEKRVLHDVEEKQTPGK
jgi:hypothetical protein